MLGARDPTFRAALREPSARSSPLHLREGDVESGQSRWERQRQGQGQVPRGRRSWAEQPWALARWLAAQRLPTFRAAPSAAPLPQPGRADDGLQRAFASQLRADCLGSTSRQAGSPTPRSRLLSTSGQLARGTQQLGQHVRGFWMGRCRAAPEARGTGTGEGSIAPSLALGAGLTSPASARPPERCPASSDALPHA